METIITLLILVILLWFWFDNLNAREAAVPICAQTCQKFGLQFLDQTVMLKKNKIQT
jgi:hypothetical protein